MSSVTQYADFTDLYSGLFNRVREQTGVTATINQAKNYINTALYDIHIGFEEKFPWAERTSVLITQPPYSTGTVTISQGGTTLTGTGTAWNTANVFGANNVRAGGKIVIDGTNAVYTISSVSSDTAAVLASRYVGADVTAGSYSYYEDEYALASDFMRPLDWQTFDDRREIIIISRRELRNRVVRNNITGTPERACIVDAAFSGNTTPVRRVLLTPAPSRAMNIPYSYVTSNLAVTAAGAGAAQLSADSDEPIVPLRYRHVILLHALANWYRDRKDDDRYVAVKAEYNDLLGRIVNSTEIGQSKPRFAPRVSGYMARARRPYDGGGGRQRYSNNDKFDQMLE